MANTVTTSEGGITILFDGSTAWEYNDEAPNGLRIGSMMFVPTATDDTIIVRDGGTATSRIMFNPTAATAYDSTIINLTGESSQRRFIPYIIGNEATAGVTLIINFI